VIRRNSRRNKFCIYVSGLRLATVSWYLQQYTFPSVPIGNTSVLTILLLLLLLLHYLLIHLLITDLLNCLLTYLLTAIEFSFGGRSTDNTNKNKYT
jgi:hypothetical protein